MVSMEQKSCVRCLGGLLYNYERGMEVSASVFNWTYTTTETHPARADTVEHGNIFAMHCSVSSMNLLAAWLLLIGYHYY